MVETATQVKWETLESELEALLVEAELIRTHQPEYNILLKDDKTPLYIHITQDVFPQVKMVRKKDVDTGRTKGTVLGPFPSGYKVKEVLKLVRPIFRWCNNPIQDRQLFHQSEKPALKACFYYHLDMCSGACLGEIAAEQYQDDINQLVQFLRGKKKEVVQDIKKQMVTAAEKHQFELAARLRDEISLITSVTSHQYKLKPDLVLPQLKESNREEGLILLRKIISEHFKLPRTFPLKRIEGYDVSNIQGNDAAVSMVTFIDGKSTPTEYRVFNIKTLNTPNDYGMLKEAISRRQNNADWGIPDLLVIDGGKGQLRAALQVWQWNTPIISIAKNPDRLILPRVTKTKQGRIKIEYTILKLPPTHLGLKLVQAVRDESHRFSRRQHHKLHEKRMMTL